MRHLSDSFLLVRLGTARRPWQSLRHFHKRPLCRDWGYHVVHRLDVLRLGGERCFHTHHCSLRFVTSCWRSVVLLELSGISTRRPWGMVVANLMGRFGQFSLARNPDPAPRTRTTFEVKAEPSEPGLFFSCGKTLSETAPATR